jgi:hypothetical protein
LPCLRRFDLFISLLHPLNSPSQSSTTKVIVLLSKLTCLYYIGPGVLLDALVAGLSAPSLHDANIHFSDTTLPPIVHLPRFINKIEERYYAVHVSFQRSFFRLSFLTQSESIGHCYPRFTLSLDMSYNQETITRQEKIMRISGALSTRLTIMEELRVTFDRTNAIFWEDLFCGAGSFGSSPTSRPSGLNAETTTTSHVFSFKTTKGLIITLLSCPLWKKWSS